MSSVQHSMASEKEQSPGGSTANFDDGTASVATATTLQPRILEYPRNFLHLTKGTVHDDPTKYHPWRKNRPGKDQIDTETPDPVALKREAESLRISLRNYTKRAYYNAVALTIQQRGDFTMDSVNGTSIKPVNEADFRETLATLERTPANEEKVFTIFHYPFRPRKYNAQTVDGWMEKHNMVLLPHPFENTPATDENGRRRRYNGCDRGGFGVAAQQAKSQAIDSLMKSMLNKAGWCIASVFKHCKKLNYEERFLTIGRETTKYQVVTHVSPMQH